ncbi:MAG: sugar phosphate isomerase/epimerase family protein [Terriglobia bacterium]
MKRREFLSTAAGATMAAMAPSHSFAGIAPASGPFRGTLCLFSKHLPEMNWRELARATQGAGFAGVDLTVRAAGHVLPERAQEDLPKAVAAIREQGLEVPMITTELTSASDPTAEPILRAAGELRIPYFKAGYYSYQYVDVRKEIAHAGAKLRGLADLARGHGVQCGYHNHEGLMGGPVWDFAPIIEAMDPQWAGYYFDIRHATAEGGAGGWKSATNLVMPRLKMIAIKDFYWGKTSKGWRTVNCPLGQGMVHWKYYFMALARDGYHGPVSLHLEYEIPGKTRAEREANTLAAAERDLAFLKAGLGEAYAG